MEKYSRKWKYVSNDNGIITKRLKVPNGWIVKSWMDGSPDSLNMLFVPEDQAHYWELEK